MLFKRISRTSAETMFMVVQNVQGSTLSADTTAVFDTGANVDGVRVTQAAATTLQAFAGVADADITNNSFGLLQIYGFRSRVLVDTSTFSAVTGTRLSPINATNTLWVSAAPSTSGPDITKAFAWVAEARISSTSSSTAFLKAFIRAL